MRDAAEQDRRSIAQQVTVLLERALQDHEPLSLLELRGLGREIWADVDAAAHVADERGSRD